MVQHDDSDNLSLLEVVLALSIIFVITLFGFLAVGGGSGSVDDIPAKISTLDGF